MLCLDPLLSQIPILSGSGKVFQRNASLPFLPSHGWGGLLPSLSGKTLQWHQSTDLTESFVLRKLSGSRKSDIKINFQLSTLRIK